MEPRVARGRTEDAEAPILGAEWWEEGKSVVGVVERFFDTSVGRCYVLKLLKPVEVDGEEVDRVSLGGLRGFKMALQAAKLTELRVNWKVHLLCTGEVPPKKEGNSPMKRFEVEVTFS